VCDIPNNFSNTNRLPDTSTRTDRSNCNLSNNTKYDINMIKMLYLVQIMAVELQYSNAQGSAIIARLSANVVTY